MDVFRQAALTVPAIRRWAEQRKQIRHSVIEMENQLSALQVHIADELQAMAGRLNDFDAQMKVVAHQSGTLPASSESGRKSLQTELDDIKALLKQQTDILAFNNIPPAPPPHLQRRVVGCLSPDFITSAARSVSEFRTALTQQGADLDTMQTILDFGCGCGRVSRRMAESLPGAVVTGADIDAEAIAWLTANHAPRLGQFVALPHLPPTSLPVSHFDLVYSISVFTHLDEAMQFAWLAELKRVTKPHAWLLLTVHGENYGRMFPQAIQDRLFADGIWYNQKSDLTEGLPDFYKNTYHTRAYVEREWAAYFDIVDYLPMGNENHQDLIVCRRRLDD